MQPEKLDALTVPLNSVCLIEASAGTGKTYTMVDLYLRLILQLGENNYPYPLMVNQILVVTYTEAATQELKERVRSRILAAKQLLLEYQKNHNSAILEQDKILAFLLTVPQKIDAAIGYLLIAEQNMDTAAIFTIHGFCQRILTQYSFDTNMPMDFKIIPNQTKLLQRLSAEFWRENFYGFDSQHAQIIAYYLTSPDKALNEISARLAMDMPKIDAFYADQNFAQLTHNIVAHNHYLKQLWLENVTSLQSLFEQSVTMLNQNSYKTSRVLNWFAEITQWANDPFAMIAPKKLAEKFTQSAVERGFKKGFQPFSHGVLREIEENIKQFDDIVYKELFLWLYAVGLQKKAIEYKSLHNLVGFEDLLRLLKNALTDNTNNKADAEKQRLAQLIREQYPFAMIDEFQDTDHWQYSIFSAIYLSVAENERYGFIMIGDPKQAIYGFRNADVFTYMHAAKEAKYYFTLTKNWRSSADLVASINRLFRFENDLLPVFLYDQINYIDVEHKETPEQFLLEGEIQAPFQFYISQLPLSPQEEYKADMALCCARSIQQWLKKSENEQGIINNRALQAKDIAILVRSHKDAQLIKDALSQLNIPSVFLSERASVFDRLIAREILYLLRACLNPLDHKATVTAIACSLFMLTAEQLYHLKQDEMQWEKWVAKFSYYRSIWDKHNILAMLYRIVLTENIQYNLLAKANSGERDLTDFLHIAELMQQASSQFENKTSLVNWLEQQINQIDNNDEHLLRLESDQELVKIVTFHKSKGLQYELVWLPFIALKQKNTNSSIYHDQDGELFWDIASSKNSYQQRMKEHFAEELRLLYVALTRAKQQVVIGLPAQFTAKNNWNAFLYLLSQGEMHHLSVESDTHIAFEEQLSKSYDTRSYIANRLPKNLFVINDTDELFDDPWRANTPFTAALNAATFTAKIENNWQISSFSALHHLHLYNTQKKLALSHYNEQVLPNNSGINDTIQDNDALNDNIDHSLSFISTTSNAHNKHHKANQPTKHLLDYLPHGVKTGLALHEFLQQIEFNQPIEASQIEHLCLLLSLDKKFATAIKSWLDDILNTPLLPANVLANKRLLSIALADIDTSNCIKEMQFYCRLTNPLDVDKFNAILFQYHPLANKQKPLLLEQIKGFIRGFIDLIFRHQEQYYIVDYKSNFLGTTVIDYSTENLKQVMLSHHYDLQYLLYVVAVHRYLKQRDRHYDYQKNFGGAIYLFLRGINGKDHQSIFFSKPNWQLIEQLDQCLS